MKSLLELLHLGDRFLLAGIFGAFAFRGLNIVGSPATASGLGGPLAVVDSDAASLALRALLAMIAIWLAFGIRTRVVALLGATLFLSAHFFTLGFDMGSDRALVLSIIAAMAAPLVLLGGGRFAMFSKGWREVL